jgi:hypothetical protein
MRHEHDRHGEAIRPGAFCCLPRCTSKPVIAIYRVIYPFFDMAAHITRDVAHLAAKRGLTVAKVETRAGMRRGFLSPVDGSKLRVTGIARPWRRVPASRQVTS